MGATPRAARPGSEATAWPLPSAATPPPATPSGPGWRLNDRRSGPGVGGRVPSSATEAAQPDSRNLLARGHLWASGKSLSSSSGTDIQRQDRTTMHPSGERPAPRLACRPARAPPPQATKGTAETMNRARLGQAGRPTRSLPGSASLERSGGLRAGKQREPARLLGNVVLRAPRLSGRVL